MGNLRNVLALASLAVVAAVVIPVGDASGPTSAVKNYDACLNAGAVAALPTANTACATALPGNSTATVTLRMSNHTESNVPIGSANLDVPPPASATDPGFTIRVNDGVHLVYDDARNQDAPGSTSTSTATELQLRNLVVNPGKSLDVTFNVNVPCQTPTSPWTLRAKQSNTFNGDPGNDFNLISASSSGFSSTISAGSAKKLAFSTQPDSMIQTSTTFTVAVSVQDGCGKPTTATGNVSLALNKPTDATAGGTTATLRSGTVAAPFSVSLDTTGTATFDLLTVDQSGIGYTLTATYGLLSKVSNTFSVLDNVVDCATQTCTAQTTPTDTSNSSLSITSPDKSGTLGIGLSAPPTSAPCQLLDGSTVTLTPLGSTFQIVPPARSSSSDSYNIQVTYTIFKRALQGIGASNIRVCKSYTSTDSTTGLTTTTMKQVPQCPAPAKKLLQTGAKQACIVSQTSSNAGDAVIVMLINSQDPWGLGG